MKSVSLISTDNPIFDNPIVYHLITDRFVCTNGDSQVDFSPACAERDAAGEFHGGSLRGVTLKLEEGWFDQLGVNTIMISAPYQQILGWVPGGFDEFKHYGYHGYYVLDYTVIDHRFGTEDDLASLVEFAHKKGIRVVIDIVMNHAGYADAATLCKLKVPVVRDGWESATPSQYHDYIDFDSPGFCEWWGKDWVRAPIAGYDAGGSDDLTATIWGLPDFKTESGRMVRPPTFFKFLPETRVRMDESRTVSGHLTQWLCMWVRKFGIDGFRCDSAKHVDLETWAKLKLHAQHALAAKASDDSICGSRSVDFWMLGEVFGQDVVYSHYFNSGFDALINFGFQRDLMSNRNLNDLYNEYIKLLCGRPGFNFLSYISSHDTYLFDRTGLCYAATALMLAPGGVLIYYGDETGRMPGHHFQSDVSQSTRSNMNWNDIDEDVLRHWRCLGKFRARHVAIARGYQRNIDFDSYAFCRIDSLTDDRIVAVPKATGWITLPVGGIFENGQELRDAYSGWIGKVVDDHVTLRAEGTVLIEAAPFTVNLL